MQKYLGLILLVIALLLGECQERMGGYMATASLSENGFARNGEAMRDVNGEPVRLWDS